MKSLRIHFKVPDTVIEHAQRGGAPIPTEELPISDSLKMLLARLSHLHAEALAKGVAPSERERSVFSVQYNIVIPMLEKELEGYGHVDDEVFPDVFQSWYTAELEKGQVSHSGMSLGSALARASKKVRRLCMSRWCAAGARE